VTVVFLSFSKMGVVQFVAVNLVSPAGRKRWVDGLLSKSLP
jgi:hypothetical protein